MPRKRSTLSKNADFVHQIIDSIITAISEHKWKDASLLLSSVTALSRRKISPYFIWKILHSIMSSTNIPLAMQIQILQVILKSSVKNYDLILDMLAYKFESIDEQDFETFYESVNESQKSKESRDLLRSVCLSYYALFYYLKWKRLLNLQEPSICKIKSPQLTDEEKRKELGKLGLKAHALLNKVYSLLQSLEIADTKGEYEKSVPCEWLLGPLLDIEAFTNIENTCIKKNSKVKNDFHGLELIEKYVRNHHFHIPALRTFYFYLIAHHSEEKIMIFEILEKIVSLSPDSSLVLQYILSLLSKESIVISGSQDRSENLKLQGCYLKSVNLKTLLRCLKLLTNFIEYKMWRKDVRAWKALKDILIIFHESWIRCWKCPQCVSSRKQVEDFSETLTSWSRFLWHETQLQLFTLEDAELLVYMGYTSFVLGYSENIAKKAIECLENLKCHDEARNLLELMRQKGSYMRDFLIYLMHQRKKRNITENQDVTVIESTNYSVINIKVKFSNSKLDRKNYFARENHSCLTLDKEEAREMFPSNGNTIDVYSRSKNPSKVRDFNDTENGNCNKNNNNNNSYVIESSVKSNKLSLGRKYKSNKNSVLKNSIENSSIKNNKNLSEIKDNFNRNREPFRSGSKQMVNNTNESCSKEDILDANKIGSEPSRDDTLKRKPEIGNEVRLKLNSLSSEIGILSRSTVAEESKTCKKSNPVTFGRKRKLSDENVSQENKKPRSV